MPEHLEQRILTLLRQWPDHDFDAATVADQVGTSHVCAGNMLAQMCRIGVIYRVERGWYSDSPKTKEP